MHRFSWFSWSVGFALLVGSAGCGLVLDAGARTDASVSDDARGIDAPIDRPDAPIDRVDAPFADLDAPHDLDAFEPFEPIDAFVAPEEDSPDPTFEPDSLLSPLDAAFSSADAFSPDVAVSTSTDGGVDAGRPDAALDASMCPAVCGPIATPMSCRASSCSGGRCVGVGGLLPCPPAGSCTQTCEGPAGMLGCAWRGSSCSPPLQACSTDGNCRSGSRCVEAGACIYRVCLPTCSTPGDTCSFTLDGTTTTGTCDGESICRPMSIACD